MPVVHKSALKAARQSEKHRARNRAVHSGVKHAIKKLQTAVESKKTDDTAALLRDVSRTLQRAASKGVLHRNTASRKLSRLTAQVRKGVIPT
jgi:small subunit ribosomal protein S20